jgi:hypothetical protein
MLATFVTRKPRRFRRCPISGPCDGHANPLTLVLDMAGFVFGGFPPIPWESIDVEDDRDIDDGNATSAMTA